MVCYNKKLNNKIYTISFNSNHIFYLDCKTRNSKIRTILESFLENVNKEYKPFKMIWTR